MKLFSIWQIFLFLPEWEVHKDEQFTNARYTHAHTHALHVRSTLLTYPYPGSRLIPPSASQQRHVLKLLTPIWELKAQMECQSQHLSCRFQITLVKGAFKNTMTPHSALEASTQLHRFSEYVKGGGLHFIFYFSSVGNSCLRNTNGEQKAGGHCKLTPRCLCFDLFMVNSTRIKALFTYKFKK